MKKNKEYTDFGDFFADHGLETFEVDREKKTFVKFVKSLFLFILVSVLMGSISSLFPLIGVATTAQAADPAAKVWSSIPDTLPPISIAQHNFFYDKNGAVFAETWSEDRIEVNSLSDISPYLKQGLIDTEDKRFYENAGFDWKGTLRSAVTGSGGGSGITQQLIKNLQFYNLLGQDDKSAATAPTLSRKVRELKIALNYEKTHTKDEILLQYFNTVAFGGPSIYGIQTASKYFFNKDAKDLDLAESALLVGTANNPSLYNLDKQSLWENAKKRQTVVLDRLLTEKHITQDEYDKAKAEDIKFNKQPKTSGTCQTSKYPFYCDYVMNFLLNDARLAATQQERQELLDKGGLKIHTYLDPQATDTMNKQLTDGFGNNNRVVVPAVLVQPGTGGVSAFAQNREWGVGDGKTELNTPEIPTGEGSTYKMFTLAAALNSGMTEKDLDFSSDCPLIPPAQYAYPAGGFKNSMSCQMQGGKMDYKKATAYSSNTWFITLEMKIGVDKVKEFSKQVGLDAPDGINNSSLSYTLGSVANSPIDVAAAFATFANKGVYCPPTPIVSMNNADGSDIAFPDGYDPSVDACRSVMSPQNAGIVLKAMRANVSGEIKDAFGVPAKIDGFDTVGKSGTNELLNSAWEQLSAQYSLYINAYDMNTPTNGVNNVWYNNKYNQWNDNVAMQSGASIFKEILKGKNNVPLDYDNPNKTFSPPVVNESSFFAVPSVLGMEPEQAVNTLQSFGITVNVSKESKNCPPGYSPGSVVEQSIKPGERLSKGTKKEITLYVGR